MKVMAVEVVVPYGGGDGCGGGGKVEVVAKRCMLMVRLLKMLDGRERDNTDAVELGGALF